MKKHLYLMRHGQTLFNSRKKIQGFCDSPLTELGKQQALQSKKYFEEHDLRFDQAYASTQERACDTLELIIGDQSYERRKNLKEWNFGTFEGESEDLNPPRNSPRGTYGDFFKTYGGETDLEVQARMNQELTAIMEQASADSNTLVVSHGAACFMFLRKWYDMDPKGPLPFAFSNCSVLHFIYEAGKFEFVEVLYPFEQ